MLKFKFLQTNTRKQNLVNIIFEDYLNDLHNILFELIDFEFDGRVNVTTNGKYYITNISYATNDIYARAICYPNEYPNLLIRMSTYPDEVNITVGERTTSQIRFLLPF
jgi:autonomous glycyl radical cofactor GrcA